MPKTFDPNDDVKKDHPPIPIVQAFILKKTRRMSGSKLDLQDIKSNVEAQNNTFEQHLKAKTTEPPTSESDKPKTDHP